VKFRFILDLAYRLFLLLGFDRALCNLKEHHRVLLLI